jgi:nicotinamide-nucleotide amidase
VQPGAEQRADALEAGLAEANERYLFSRDEQTTAELVIDLLRAQGLTLGTAESCTGGLVAARLTDIPGSSDVFRGAIVAYANEVKAAQLGVSEAVLQEHGAVSEETAAAMAHGARERLGVDVAVAVTGVAGPDGGTEEKPVGLVYLHAAGPSGELARRLDFPGDRETIRQRSAVAALHLVRRLVTQS